MSHIDEVNKIMKQINDLTDDIYESLADKDSKRLELAKKRLHTVLSKATCEDTQKK